MPFSDHKLRVVLPELGDASLSVEDQARTVLHLLLDCIENPGPLQIALETSDRCPNCDGPTESTTSPYCSETCRDQAAFVRQLRAAFATDAILTPEKQIVFGERLWWLLGGGLPMRESRIPESAKRQVSKRSGGKCETCGEPMTAVENVGSGCNRPLHLLAVCGICSKTKAFGDVEFSRNPYVIQQLSELANRVGAETPLRQCDDANSWDWRAFVKARRSLHSEAT